MSPRQEQVRPMNTVGRDVPRIDAVERVTGRAEYTRDVRLPGMLYARVLRSRHPHARIVRIDTSRAEAMPGVRAVISHENYHWIYGSGSIAWRPALQRRGERHHDARPPHVRHPGEVCGSAGRGGRC